MQAGTFCGWMYRETGRPTPELLAHPSRVSPLHYDAEPFAGVVHHPLLNKRIEFGKSEVAVFRRALFAELRRKRKFALRLGHVTRGQPTGPYPRDLHDMYSVSAGG